MSEPESQAINKSQLKRIFPHADDNDLSRLADELNLLHTNCGLQSCFQKAHFFAQIREECGSGLKIRSEDLNYTPQRLIDVFSYYKKNNKEAEADGYLKSEKSKDGKTKPGQPANPEVIANNVYANSNGNGNSKSGDGWNYRGRGLFQITGRANYAACAKKYRALFPGSATDFEKNPELLEQFTFAVRSAVCYWVIRGMDKIADSGSDAKVDKITAIINQHTDSYAKRRDHFKVAYHAFK